MQSSSHGALPRSYSAAFSMADGLNVPRASDDREIAQALLNSSRFPPRQSSLTKASISLYRLDGFTEREESSDSFAGAPAVGGNRRLYHTSNTWTSSSGEWPSEQDKLEDRSVYVEEFNRLARKHGVRPMSLESEDLSTDPALHPVEKQGGWFSRKILRRTSSSQSIKVKPEKQLKHKRSISDLSMRLKAKKDRLKDKDLQELVRICGTSLLYLPEEYAVGSLSIPTCLRATAQYLIQHAPTSRGVFRIPGAHTTVGNLYNHYCALDDDGVLISGTVRCPILPDHIPCDVHDVASAFKKMISGLPGGILGSLQLFDAFISIQTQLLPYPELTRTKQSRVKARLIALAIRSVKSQFRREFICAVFGLLSLVGRTAEVAKREDDHGRPLPTNDLMGYGPLGIIFGPLLVGDLLDSYSMRLANPHGGLILLPISPSKPKKEKQKKSKSAEEGAAFNSYVDKVKVANRITEMLITHWRDVVRHMENLKYLKTSSSRASLSVDESRPAQALRPSASEHFALRLPPDWEGSSSPRRAERSISPTPRRRAGRIMLPLEARDQDDGLQVRKRRPRGRQVSGHMLSNSRSMGMLAPTTEERLDEEQVSTSSRRPVESASTKFQPKGKEVLRTNQSMKHSTTESSSETLVDNTKLHNEHPSTLQGTQTSSSKSQTNINNNDLQINAHEYATSSGRPNRRRPRQREAVWPGATNLELLRHAMLEPTINSPSKLTAQIHSSVMQEPKSDSPANSASQTPKHVVQEPKSDNPAKSTSQTPKYVVQEPKSDNPAKSTSQTPKYVVQEPKEDRPENSIPQQDPKSDSTLKSTSPPLNHAMQEPNGNSSAILSSNVLNPHVRIITVPDIPAGTVSGLVRRIAASEPSQQSTLSTSMFRRLVSKSAYVDSPKVLKPSLIGIGVKDPLSVVSQEDDVASLAVLAKVLETTTSQTTKMSQPELTHQEQPIDSAIILPDDFSLPSEQAVLNPPKQDDRSKLMVGPLSRPVSSIAHDSATTHNVSEETDSAARSAIHFSPHRHSTNGSPTKRGSPTNSVKALAARFNTADVKEPLESPTKISPSKTPIAEPWSQDESRKDSVIAPYTTNPPSPTRSEKSAKSEKSPRWSSTVRQHTLAKSYVQNKSPRTWSAPRRALKGAVNESSPFTSTFIAKKSIENPTSPTRPAESIADFVPLPEEKSIIGSNMDGSPSVVPEDRFLPALSSLETQHTLPLTQQSRSAREPAAVATTEELPQHARPFQFLNNPPPRSPHVHFEVSNGKKPEDLDKNTDFISRERSTNSDTSMPSVTPPVRSNSVLHSQIQTLQSQVFQKSEEVRHLRHQLETRSKLDVGTLSDQLREAKKEVQMWKRRAEISEKQVEMLTNIPSRSNSTRAQPSKRHSEQPSTIHSGHIDESPKVKDKTRKIMQGMDGTTSSGDWSSQATTDTVIREVGKAITGDKDLVWVQEIERALDSAGPHEMK